MDRAEFDLTYLSHMNPQQKEAVHAVDGATLLLAVPGSGKTTVLVARLGYMVCCCQIPPESILTMTYTVAATREMRARFARQFGPKYADTMEFRTINGISAKIIEFYGKTKGKGQIFSLMNSEGDRAKLIGDIYRRVKGEFATPSIIKEYQTEITYAKNMMLTPEGIEERDEEIESFSEIFRIYCAELKRARLMDYDDQMKYALQILQTQPDVRAHFQDRYIYFCVDEAQDTSRIQHRIISLLAEKSRNIFMVGDEDQSIYSFRAAYPQALMDFEKTYPGARILLMEENYRSTPEILSVANAFIRENRDRHPKENRAVREPGAQVQRIYIERQELQLWYLLTVAQNCTEETAVLYRNHDSAIALVDLLERRQIPYRRKQNDPGFFTHRVVLDVLHIIGFARDGKNEEIFMQIYYKICGGVSKKAAEYACAQSRRSGKPILFELAAAPGITEAVRNSVIATVSALAGLLKDSAVDGIERICCSMGYENYVEQHKLDKKKLSTLRLLARQEETLVGLAERVRQLQELMARHENPEDACFELSTVHASKGLEYHRVFLLDVVNGIFPLLEQDQQEERRLFYVAMTRARDQLCLFDCADSPSVFIQEVCQSLPAERPEEGDLFAPLHRNLCGQKYTHQLYGKGRVAASCGDTCLLVYETGRVELMNLSRMLQQRAVVLKKPTEEHRKLAPVGGEGQWQAPRKRKLSREEQKRCCEQARPGNRIRHSKFGPGVITAYRDPFVTIRFPGFREEKKFHLLDAVQEGFLTQEE